MEQRNEAFCDESQEGFISTPPTDAELLGIELSEGEEICSETIEEFLNGKGDDDE